MLKDNWFIKQSSASQDEHLQRQLQHPLVLSRFPILKPRQCSSPSTEKIVIQDSAMYLDLKHNYSVILTAFGKLDIKYFLRGEERSFTLCISLFSSHTKSFVTFWQLEDIRKLCPEERNRLFKNCEKKCFLSKNTFFFFFSLI